MDFRATEGAVQLRLRVKPNEVHVSVDVGGQKNAAASSTTIFEGKNLRLGSGGHLGFSTYMGSYESPSAAKLPDMTVVSKFEVKSYDAAAQGEQTKDTPVTKAAAANASEKSDFIAEHSGLKGFREEGNALRELTNLVYKVVSATKPRRAKMEAAVKFFDAKLTSLEGLFQ